MEKIKNLPVIRFVAFAFALAVVLGFSSLMFQLTASAESTDDIPISTDYDKNISFGNLGNYPCIKASLGSDIDYLRFRNIHLSLNTSYSKFVILGRVPNTNSYKNLTNFYAEPYSYNNYNGISVFGIGDIDYYNALYKYKLSFNQMVISNVDTLAINLDRSSFSSDDFAIYSTKYMSEISNLKDEFYIVYKGSNVKSDLDNFGDEVVASLTPNTEFKDSLDNSPKAEFMTCPSFTREDGSLPLWFKDFTADGQQYPMFSYYISDNGNKHRYQIRLSYSSSQSDVVNTIFGNINENNISEQEKTLRDLSLFLKGQLPIGSSNYTKFMALKPYMELILKKPQYISFDEAFTLNSNQMNFETSEVKGNKVYTICLSDYSDIVANYIYRAEIVDMQTSQILDTTYFCSNKTYNKGDSGTGVKIYDYGDNYNGMIDDIKNNTPSVTPSIDNKFSTTGDIINMQDNDYLSGLKIDNIFSVLQQSAKSIGAFFQACLNIIPSAILSILLSTLSLLIVLRVLGR